MTPELKPCPFCGSEPVRVGTEWCRCSNTPGDCPGRGFLANAEQWNRRTPDLTEALARLKALEERIRNTKPERPAWADEIAAIRKAMGATESPS